MKLVSFIIELKTWKEASKLWGKIFFKVRIFSRRGYYEKLYKGLKNHNWNLATSKERFLMRIILSRMSPLKIQRSIDCGINRYLLISAFVS